MLGSHLCLLSQNNLDITLNVLLGVCRKLVPKQRTEVSSFKSCTLGHPSFLWRSGLGEVVCSFFLLLLHPCSQSPGSSRHCRHEADHSMQQTFANSPSHPHARLINSKVAAFSYGTVMLFIPLQLQTLLVSRNSGHFVLRVAKV